MNKNNENSNMKYSFFGYNLYSSSFASSPKQETTGNQILEKKKFKKIFFKF
jgi:hypothetical protein